MPLPQQQIRHNNKLSSANPLVYIDSLTPGLSRFPLTQNFIAEVAHLCFVVPCPKVGFAEMQSFADPQNPIFDTAGLIQPVFAVGSPALKKCR